MSNSFPFTNVKIRNLEVGKRKRYTDSKTPGLVLDHTANGKKTFRFRRRSLGKETTVTIGGFGDWTVEEARKRATEISFDLDNGIDPNQERRAVRDSLTIAELIELHTMDFAQKIKTGDRSQKSLDDVLSNWKNHCKTKLQGYRIVEFTDTNAIHFLDRLTLSTSPSVHNKCLTLLKSAFNFAKTKKLVESNPFQGIKKMPTAARKRYLFAEEVNAFFESLTYEKPVYQDLCMLLLLTAQRKGVVFSMEWSEIDFKHKLWVIPSKKMKTADEHSVPLTSYVIDILDRRKKEAGSNIQYVFPSENSLSGHVTDKSGRSGFWRRIIDRAGLYSTDPAKTVRLHDLRRTCASWLAAEGDLQVASDLLAHSNIQTTVDAYAHLSNQHVRKSLEGLNHRLLNPLLNTEGSTDLDSQLMSKIAVMSEDGKRKLLDFLNL